MYEFNGRRGLPTLLAFARGGYRTGAAHMMVPAEILPDASIYWLLAEAMWPAVKQVSMRASAGAVLRGAWPIAAGNALAARKTPATDKQSRSLRPSARAAEPDRRSGDGTSDLPLRTAPSRLPLHGMCGGSIGTHDMHELSLQLST